MDLPQAAQDGTLSPINGHTLEAAFGQGHRAAEVKLLLNSYGDMGRLVGFGLGISE